MSGSLLIVVGFALGLATPLAVGRLTRSVTPHSPPDSAVPDETGAAATVSKLRHDLRTPLSVVRGYSDLLLRPASGDLNAKQQRYLENIRAAAQNLEELLNSTRAAAPGISAGNGE
jgi:K+-sensing histidine kinase KdpD